MSINIVSDKYAIINVNMGIRHVTWGESRDYHSGNAYEIYHVTVTYKNGFMRFPYQTRDEAKDMFDKIREALSFRKGDK